MIADQVAVEHLVAGSAAGCRPAEREMGARLQLDQGRLGVARLVGIVIGQGVNIPRLGRGGGQNELGLPPGATTPGSIRPRIEMFAVRNTSLPAHGSPGPGAEPVATGLTALDWPAEWNSDARTHVRPGAAEAGRGRAARASARRGGGRHELVIFRRQASFGAELRVDGPGDFELRRITPAANSIGACQVTLPVCSSTFSPGQMSEYSWTSAAGLTVKSPSRAVIARGR